MTNIHFRYIISITITFCFLSANNNKYAYSSIVNVPDLSFFNHVYTGLDILEQMDFDIANKTSGARFVFLTYLKTVSKSIGLKHLKSTTSTSILNAKDKKILFMMQL